MSSTALNASWCPTTGMTCICTNEPLLTFEVGCFSKRCSLKENLFSTNLTRSACGIPEDNHANLTPALAGVLGMLALIMVILRLVQRVFLKKSFGWDDGMILMALICAVALNCMAFPLQKYGLGTNIWTIPFSNITRQLQYLYLSEVFYMPAEAFTQLSFLAFYQRILPRSKYQYVGYALGGITFIFGTSNTLVMILQCTPPSDFWRGWAGKVNGYCINTSAYSWYRAAMHIAMNLSIIAFPLWPLSKLSFSKRKKILVLLMLGTGVL
ncbi:hypothetical protein BDV28DRAFT_160402 [Aspergillus coremiiformis]|uniref:Rhodopsin domain-containing protein n=1 Tax=Aspergillus coremiiformis TaxID=138285 RepID=A0A5N6YX84_9EURO|nr:hypothetical protein BDV28DRAFT_160402 [Aspergillus coremiiformis]